MIHSSTMVEIWWVPKFGFAASNTFVLTFSFSHRNEIHHSRQILLEDSQAICFPLSFKTGMPSNFTSLLVASVASPVFTNQHSFEPCIYNDSLISLANYGIETLTCQCSGWSFNVSPSNPNQIQILTQYNGDINPVDFIPNTVTGFEILVPDSSCMAMIPWQIYNNLEDLAIYLTYPSPWPSPVSNGPANMNFLPPNVKQFAVNGPITSMPANLWTCPHLETLGVLTWSVQNYVTSVPQWDGVSIAKNFTFIVFDGFDLDGNEFPDFSIWSPNLQYITLGGALNRLPTLSGILPQASLFIRIAKLQQIDQWDWFLRFPSSTSIYINFPDMTSFCSNCTFHASVSYLDINLPNVNYLNLTFVNGSQILSLAVSAPLKNNPIASIAGIDQLPKLLSVIFQNTLFGSGSPTMLDSLCTVSPNLFSLEITNSTISNFPSLSNCGSLSELLLTFCANLNSSTMPSFTLLPSLYSVNFSGNGFTSLTTSVCGASSLVEFDLSNNLLINLPNCGHYPVSGSTIFYLQGNQISQFSQVQHLANFTTYVTELWLRSNLLGSGTPIVANFLAFFPYLSVLDINNNLVSGSLASRPWTNFINQLSEFDIGHNHFSGSISEALFTTIISTRTYDFSFNNFSGALSLNLLCGTFFNFNLRSNQLDSWVNINPLNPNSCSNSPLQFLDIGYNLFSSIPSSNFSQIPFQYLYMDGNPNFQGQPLPMFAYNSTIPRSFMNFSTCGFIDTLTEELFNGTAAIDLSNNFFHGTIPYGVWTAISFLNLSNNLLSGPIPSFDYDPVMLQMENMLRTYQYTVDLSSNLLYGTIPTTIKWYSIGTLSFANNTGLTGPVPFFPALGLFGRFAATAIDFSNCAELDFCAYTDYTNILQVTKSCNLQGTQVCHCPQLYPDCDTSFCPAPTACPGSPPAPNFICVNGVWTTSGSLSPPSPIVISGPSNIGGNIITSNPVTIVISFPSGTSNQPGFGGSSPLVNIGGCFESSDGSLVLPVSLSDIEYLGSQKGATYVHLIGQNGANCTASLDSLLLKVQQANSCKKVNAKSSSSSNSDNLVVIFTVDHSSCNLWWIITVSVLGGVILICAIAALVWAACCRKQFKLVNSQKD